MTSRSVILLLSTFALALTLSACGGTEASPPSDRDATTTTSSTAAETTPTSATIPEGAVVIRPNGDQMTFATTEFTVKAGEEVTLVFENTAKSAAMSHNVLIVASEDDINRVGQASMAAGAAKAYVPEDDAVLAATPLAAPGETVEVTFTAPSTPGEYPYICTFAGHYMMMKGVMTVTA